MAQGEAEVVVGEAVARLISARFQSSASVAGISESPSGGHDLSPMPKATREVPAASCPDSFSTGSVFKGKVGRNDSRNRYALQPVMLVSPICAKPASLERGGRRGENTSGLLLGFC